MKVVVDFEVCASTGSCMQVCPEAFEVRSDGYLHILQEEPRAELQGMSARPPTCARRGAPSLEE
jgi:ferredoxin